MPQFANDLLSVLAEFVPRVLGTGAALLGALLAALLLQRLIGRALEGLGLDDLFERTGASGSLERLGYGGGPSALIGTFVFWSVLLSGVAVSLSVLGLSSLEDLTGRLISLSGRAVVALIILLAGVMLAGWLAELATRRSEQAGLRGANVFGRAVFFVVVVVAGLLAASQLGIETSLLVILAIVALATVGLVVAIAVGQGLVALSGNIAAGRYVQDGVEEGDVISVAGIEGTVVELDYASVTVRSDDGYLHRIPNSTLLTNTVRKRA